MPGFKTNLAILSGKFCVLQKLLPSWYLGKSQLGLNTCTSANVCLYCWKLPSNKIQQTADCKTISNFVSKESKKKSKAKNKTAEEFISFSTDHCVFSKPLKKLTITPTWLALKETNEKSI